jgi:transglutaminase-like putative cysteine protease
MRRSTLLRAAGSAAAGLALPLPALAVPASDAFAPDSARWHTYVVTTEMHLAKTGPSRAWIPVPSFASSWIRPLGTSWTTNATSAELFTAAATGAQMVALRWDAADATPVAIVRSTVATRDRFADLSRPATAPALSDADRARYTAPTRWIPTDGIVKSTADAIVAGSTSDVDRARRIYAWIVANTYRNASTRGCGSGDIAGLLRSGNLGGKCADLNGLYVGLARAAGLPARDLYGIRVAPSRFGYHSLGANSAVITGAQHCRAEVYLAGHGWVPVDPADVRKVMLEEPPGNLAANDAKVAAANATLFGAWEGNWIAYNDGADIALPGSSAAPLPFLMYPQAVNADVACDCLTPSAVSYRITAETIAGTA